MMINESDYADLLVRTVQKAATEGHSVLPAAALGERLRRAASDQTWKDFGYSTLSRFLRSEKVEARVEITTTDKGALAVRAKPGAAQTQTPPRKEYNRLRRPVWAAFVQSEPTGRRFLNRITGAVRSGLEGAPVPYDEWAEINPIPVDDQRAWAMQFLRSKGLPASASINDALSQSSWAHAFLLALGAHGADWNKVRSSKVAAIVDAWASSKGIAHDLVFQSHTTATPGPILQSTAPETGSRGDKQAILAALASLPIEELRKVWLPAGALLDAMNKE